MSTIKIEPTLQGLLQKYKIDALTGVALVWGTTKINEPASDKEIPMQPWRYNRKFIELQRLVATNIVEHPSMFRFCCIADQTKWDLKALLYREFDLCEYISGSKIVSVQAVFNQSSGSVIVKLDSGMIASVEVGARLAAGEAMIDRHEIIARRGVASDLVVDTQVPQSSVYMLTSSGNKAYKDIDNELYGLREQEIEFIRAAFETSKNPVLIDQCQKRHLRLVTIVELAIESDNNGKCITLIN